MRVLCIENPKGPRLKTPAIVSEGNVYNVVDSGKHLFLKSRAYYKVAEDTKHYYDQSIFIPLSDKDETSYADKVLEKIFVPVKKTLK